jgi:hypothetical protein
MAKAKEGNLIVRKKVVSGKILAENLVGYFKGKYPDNNIKEW